MKPESSAADSAPAKISLLKAGAIAGALGLVAWLATPFLLPVRLPADFPALPDLAKANPGLREALQLADREARRRPGSAEAVGRLAMTYHANLMFEPASTAYRVVSRLAPGDSQWVYAQAFLQEESGNEKAELKLLEQTLRLKSSHVPALIKLADWYFKQDQLEQAARYYEKAAAVSGGGATLQGQFGLARIAARRHEWGRVIEVLTPLLREYSYVLPLHELAAEAYRALGQNAQAAQAEQNLGLGRWKFVPPPDDPLNEQLIALCFSSTRLLKQAGLQVRLGNPERALAVARRAAEVEPGDADVHNFLASKLISFYGERPEAIAGSLAELAECLRLRPDDPLPLWNYTNDFFKTPKPPQAVERLRELMRPYAGRADAHFYLGQVADGLGQTAEAVAQYQAALRTNPNDSGIYSKLGQTADAAGRLDEAIGHFQKAVQLNPNNTGARFNLGISLMQRGRYEQGMQEFNELLRLNAHDAATHFAMGFAALYSKRVDEAVASFRLGLRFKPEDPEGHFGLAQAYAAQRKPQDAVAELREALRLRPNFQAAREMLQQISR